MARHSQGEVRVGGEEEMDRSERLIANWNLERNGQERERKWMLGVVRECERVTTPGRNGACRRIAASERRSRTPTNIHRSTSMQSEAYMATAPNFGHHTLARSRVRGMYKPETSAYEGREGDCFSEEQQVNVQNCTRTMSPSDPAEKNQSNSALSLGSIHFEMERKSWLRGEPSNIQVPSTPATSPIRPWAIWDEELENRDPSYPVQGHHHSRVGLGPGPSPVGRTGMETWSGRLWDVKERVTGASSTILHQRSYSSLSESSSCGRCNYDDRQVNRGRMGMRMRSDTSRMSHETYEGETYEGTERLLESDYHSHTDREGGRPDNEGEDCRRRQVWKSILGDGFSPHWLVLALFLATLAIITIASGLFASPQSPSPSRQKSFSLPKAALERGSEDARPDGRSTQRSRSRIDSKCVGNPPGQPTAWTAGASVDSVETAAVAGVGAQCNCATGGDRRSCCGCSGDGCVVESGRGVDLSQPRTAKGDEGRASDSQDNDGYMWTSSQGRHGHYCEHLGSDLTASGLTESFPSLFCSGGDGGRGCSKGDKFVRGACWRVSVEGRDLPLSLTGVYQLVVPTGKFPEKTHHHRAQDETYTPLLPIQSGLLPSHYWERRRQGVEQGKILDMRMQREGGAQGVDNPNSGFLSSEGLLPGPTPKSLIQEETSPRSSPTSPSEHSLEVSRFLYWDGAAGGHFVLDDDISLANGVLGYMERNIAEGEASSAFGRGPVPTQKQDSVAHSASGSRVAGETWMLDSPRLQEWVTVDDVYVTCLEGFAGDL
ncbi:unnamed protein product [Choristocarpus tenellus]